MSFPRSQTLLERFDYLYARWCDGVDTPDDFNMLAVNELIICVTDRMTDFDELRDAVPAWCYTLKAADPAFEHSLRLLINIAERKWQREQELSETE